MGHNASIDVDFLVWHLVVLSECGPCQSHQRVFVMDDRITGAITILGVYCGVVGSRPVPFPEPFRAWQLCLLGGRSSSSQEIL